MSQGVHESYGEEPDQFFERYQRSESQGPIIIAIHGGFWKPEHDREHMRALAAALGEKGFQVILAEYRRIPGDPDAAINDIHRIMSTLFPASFILLGYSAGGHLALMTAPFRFQVEAIIALAPVTDLERTEREGLGEGAVEKWLGQPAADRGDLNPITDSSLEIPIRILHGVDDERVPIEHSRDYVTAMQAVDIDAQLQELPGLGHFELMDPSGIVLSKILELFEN